MPPGQDDSKADEGRILSPEELDIADDDHVEEIDEGRYVVSSDVRSDSITSTPADPDPSQQPDQQPDRNAFTDASVHDWLRDDMGDTNSRYGFDVTAKFDANVSQQQMVSNDIVTVFESLMLWYARQVDGSTPVEEVLGILLSESNVPVRYPPESLHELLESTDLSGEDSIDDLLAAVSDDDGVQL